MFLQQKMMPTEVSLHFSHVTTSYFSITHLNPNYEKHDVDKQKHCQAHLNIHTTLWLLGTFPNDMDLDLTLFTLWCYTVSESSPERKNQNTDRKELDFPFENSDEDLYVRENFPSTFFYNIETVLEKRNVGFSLHEDLHLTT